MKRIAPLLLVVLLAAPAFAQAEEEPEAAPQPKPQTITLPAGTKVLLVLKNAVSSKTARVGDAVYLQTAFPVTQEDRVVIPAGAYVQGEITSVKRAGRVKGRAEIQMHFTRMIYPNGYTVKMPGAVEGTDSSDAQRVEDKEGTVRAEGTKGRDAVTMAGTTGTGTLIGAGLGGARGAGIGAGVGAGVGLLTVLLTRGHEVRFEAGTSVDMVLQRPLTLDLARIGQLDAAAPPPPVPQRPYVQQQPTQTPQPPVIIPR